MNDKDNYLKLVPFILTIVVIVYDALVFKLHPLDHFHFYLFIILVIPIYTYALSYWTLEILKESFDRPRPYQTKQFHYPDETELECLVDFQPSFKDCTNLDNPCGWKMWSFPSGHTERTTAYMVAACIITAANWAYTNWVLKAQKSPSNAKSIVHQVLSFTLMIVMILSAIVLIASQIVARLTTIKHFLSDVITGMLTSLVYFPVFLLLMPDVPEKVKRGDSSEESEHLVTNIDALA